MAKSQFLQARWSMGVALFSLALVACGGGSGAGISPSPPPSPAPTPAPTPTPTPTPAPTPTPTPTPSSAFQTAEYNRSSGPAQHGAITPWAAGYSGTGVTIGVIDSGIDTTSPEFAGRIAASSRDVVDSSRGLDNADDDHGTQVAMTAAAARDSTGVVGIAWNANIAMYRADSIGSCATKVDTDPKSGCKFNDVAIAAGVNAAVAGGAKVINISLGGGTAGAQLRGAIANAASNGVVVIVSAGNDGDSTEAGVDPTNPDPFATGLRMAGNGNVIIAGSVNSANAFSAFSNKAGTEAVWFLSARGERVCCVYENGVLKIVTNPDGTRSQYVVSGTSFSAPQIAGAAALLRQAFPNLTAVQVVDLLLRTALDAGDPGTDAIFGRGVLNITAAFAPQGATTLAGGTTAMPLGDTTGVTSAPMGDAGQRGNLINGIVLDGYGRAYQVNFSAGFRSAQVQPRLGPALERETRFIDVGTDSVSLSFQVDAKGRVARMPWTGQLRLTPHDAVVSRVLAARVSARVAPDSGIAFAFSQGSDGLVAHLQGRSRPAFLIARSPLDDVGFGRDESFSFAGRHRFGQWGLTIGAEHGAAISAAPVLTEASSLGQRRLDPAQRLSVSFDRRFGDFDAALGASWLGEQRTVLGARFHEGFGPGGANSLFLDANGEWRIAEGWRLGAAWRGGLTWANTGGSIAPGSRLTTSAWAIDLTRQNTLRSGDSLGLRISQPLRVESGGLTFSLPVGYSYSSLQPTYGLVPLSLVPGGREVNAELLWRAPLLTGSAMVSLFYRKDPGHYAALRDDQGAAVSWSKQF